MRASEFPVRCPYCATRAIIEHSQSRLGVDRSNRLRGTNVGCQDCGNEFELYYY